MSEPEPRFCEAQIRPQTLYEPAEFCESEAMPGSDYCEAHDPDALEDYLVARAEARREDPDFYDRY